MTFYVYRDIAGEWRWTLIARNGQSIANSGEGYKRKGNCLKAISRIQCGASTATVEVESTHSVPRAQLNEADKL